MREMSKTFLESAAAVPEARRHVQELSDDGLSVVRYQTKQDAKLTQRPIEDIVQRLGRISQSSNPVLELISQGLESYEVYDLVTSINPEKVNLLSYQQNQDVGQALWKLMSKPAMHREMLQAMRSIRGNSFGYNSVPKTKHRKSDACFHTY